MVIFVSLSQHWDNLMTKLDRAERKLRPEDGERNIERPMVKLHYDGNEKSTSCVKVTEVPVEKVKKKNVQYEQ